MLPRPQSRYRPSPGLLSSLKSQRIHPCSQAPCALCPFPTRFRTSPLDLCNATSAHLPRSSRKRPPHPNSFIRATKCMGSPCLAWTLLRSAARHACTRGTHGLPRCPPPSSLPAGSEPLKKELAPLPPHFRCDQLPHSWRPSAPRITAHPAATLTLLLLRVRSRWRAGGGAAAAHV